MTTVESACTGECFHCQSVHVNVSERPYLAGTWSTPRVTGTPPEPRAWCSFTKIDEEHALVFGGQTDGDRRLNDIYMLNKQEWVCARNSSYVEQ